MGTCPGTRWCRQGKVICGTQAGKGCAEHNNQPCPCSQIHQSQNQLKGRSGRMHLIFALCAAHKAVAKPHCWEVCHPHSCCQHKCVHSRFSIICSCTSSVKTHFPPFLVLSSSPSVRPDHLQVPLLAVFGQATIFVSLG